VPPIVRLEKAMAGLVAAGAERIAVVRRAAAGLLILEVVAERRLQAVRRLHEQCDAPRKRLFPVRVVLPPEVRRDGRRIGTIRLRIRDAWLADEIRIVD